MKVFAQYAIKLVECWSNGQHSNSFVRIAMGLMKQHIIPNIEARFLLQWSVSRSCRLQWAACRSVIVSGSCEAAVLFIYRYVAATCSWYSEKDNNFDVSQTSAFVLRRRLSD